MRLKPDVLSWSFCVNFVWKFKKVSENTKILFAYTALALVLYILFFNKMKKACAAIM